jgi:hypothetical protein
VAREVVVFDGAGNEQGRIRAPGAQVVSLPCAGLPGQAERLDLDVVRVGGGEPYRTCTAEEAASRAGDEGYGKLSFRDRLASLRFLDPERDVVALGEGRTVAIGAELRTEGGAVCIVPAERAGLLDALRGASRGQEAVLRGEGVRLPAGGRCVLVESVSLRPEAAADEPPWRVTVRAPGAEPVILTEPGDRVVRWACQHRPGGGEAATVRLREFRAVELEAGGRRVVAELADTPAARSWGLQGRRGLAEDEGMLFYFEEPLMPAFVMKTVAFPLSIAFIRADGTITNIEGRAPGELRSAAPPVPVQHVLEMERGWFEGHGVKPGDKVLIP